MLKYCVKCVTPNTRPKLEFDQNGVCSACISAAQKKTEINWKEREAQLRSILDRNRKKTPGKYDCIIPVSGGKDSTYQVHIVKNVYKMNPLALTFRTLARTPRGEENLQSLRNMGIDHIDFSPNPVAVNSITRRGFEEFGDCSLLDHLATHGIVPRMACQLGIPLVIWGENPYMEYGGPAKDRTQSQFNRKLIEELPILQGRMAEDWVDDKISLEDLQSMIIPTQKELDDAGYMPIFLGYFLPWDAKQNVAIATKYGFQVRENGPVMGLYDYADLDCMNIVIHHYFKWLKFGFNRITDNASNEIRKGRMTREQGIKLVREKDGIKPPKEYITIFCRQIGITEKRFWQIVEKYRNHDVWKKNKKGQWYIEGWIAGDKVPDRFPHLKLSPQEKAKLFGRCNIKF